MSSSHIREGVSAAIDVAEQLFKMAVVLLLLAVGSCTAAVGTAIYFAVR